jgi:hypothetical protein
VLNAWLQEAYDIGHRREMARRRRAHTWVNVARWWVDSRASPPPWAPSGHRCLHRCSPLTRSLGRAKWNGWLGFEGRDTGRFLFYRRAQLTVDLRWTTIANLDQSRPRWYVDYAAQSFRFGFFALHRVEWTVTGRFFRMLDRANFRIWAKFLFKNFS